MRLAAALPLVALLGCGGARPARPLAAAGSNHDDGIGQLARASVKVWSVAEVEPGELATGVEIDDEARYGGFIYGAAATGGFSYGAGFELVDPSSIDRSPTYELASVGNAGAITGRITWPRPPSIPASLETPCGALPRSSLRLGGGGAVGGAVVFLATIARGRPLASMSGYTRIGGAVYRDGCALWPAVQVQAPAPGPLRITNSVVASLPVTVEHRPHAADGAATTREVLLDRGAATIVAANPGVTRIAATDGSVAPAWVVALPHPYVTLTTESGAYRLDDVVPGDYELVVWHPPVITAVKGGAVVVGEPVVVRRRVTVVADAPTRVDVALP